MIANDADASEAACMGIEKHLKSVHADKLNNECLRVIDRSGLSETPFGSKAELLSCIEKKYSEYEHKEKYS